MVHNRLANQHSVKRISMQKRQSDQMKSGFFIEIQRINAMLFTLDRDETFWRLR